MLTLINNVKGGRAFVCVKYKPIRTWKNKLNAVIIAWIVTARSLEALDTDAAHSERRSRN